MKPVNAYAAEKAKDPLKPFVIQRRDPGPHDVAIEILYCGVCHSDVHQARDEWGNSTFPMVPGHEIVGKVTQTGASVTRFKAGDMVGVGCFVDSCRECQPCRQHLQQYCEKGMNLTYNGVEKDGKTATYGGYSTNIVVDENYVLTIPANLPPENAAPLLCAGITTYSPLRQWKIKPRDKVAVVGLGGLGHMAVKLASAMEAEVTVLSTSDSKKNDAMKFGAKHFVNTRDGKAFTEYANFFDFMINTASGNINLEHYLQLLKQDATMVCVGVPEQPFSLNAFPLIMKRRRLAGSLIGGIKETQEMLNFCGSHGISADIELIPINKINEAYDRMVKGEVRYRFVIDINSLRSG
ncbi:NADP-dependent alcohol dehydrogenase C 2 [Aquicella siphonis]|uniref:NADP-dependent alcohol dehydrogenase C 2 n=1 Tax=Aquicella siphonis TaxID=254247 RepID=A0A5E4PKA0_9COXI|nr:NADP-dependent alcohol dehydrogenase C 2 [Aquicella siphonis]